MHFLDTNLKIQNFLGREAGSSNFNQQYGLIGPKFFPYKKESYFKGTCIQC